MKTKTVLPAGEYWVGDPRYAIRHSEWIVWLEAADYDASPSPRILEAELRGMRAVGVGTAYGDGEYRDQAGRCYPVDAGLIGAVPVGIARNAPEGMHRVMFDEDFIVSYDAGTIHIGEIAINTKGSDDGSDDDGDDE